MLSVKSHRRDNVKRVLKSTALPFHSSKNQLQDRDTCTQSQNRRPVIIRGGLHQGLQISETLRSSLMTLPEDPLMTTSAGRQCFHYSAVQDMK